MPSRRVTGALVACGLAVAPASAAAELRVRDRLTLAKPDGTPVTFAPDIRVWCGPWAPDVRVPSIHVRVGGLPRAGRAPARWELHAVLADVRRRPVVRLPNSFVFDHPRGAQLYATDGSNEVNSDTEESTGAIRFDRVRCGRRMRIAFRFTGRVGSEFFDGETWTVRGSFRASG